MAARVHAVLGPLNPPFGASDTDPVSEEADLEHAIAVVCAFAEEMNAWETRMYYRSRIQSGQYVPESRERELEGTSYEDVQAEYHPIFDRHCTERERKLGGFPSGWSKGGHYAGVEAGAVTGAELVKPGRIEVTVKGGLFPDQEFKFVLFEKAAGWKIDNAFSRNGADPSWDRHPL